MTLGTKRNALPAAEMTGNAKYRAAYEKYVDAANALLPFVDLVEEL